MPHSPDSRVEKQTRLGRRGGEMDTEVEGTEDEGTKGKRGIEGVLRKVKSILSKNTGEGGIRDEEEGGTGEGEE